MGVVEREVLQFDDRMCGFNAECFAHPMIGYHTILCQCNPCNPVVNTAEEGLSLTLQPLRDDHPEESFKSAVPMPTVFLFTSEAVHVIILHPVKSGAVHDAAGDAAHGAEDAAATEHEKFRVGEELFLIGHQRHLREKGPDGVGEDIDTATLIEERMTSASDLFEECCQVCPCLSARQVKALRALRDAFAQCHVGEAHRAIALVMSFPDIEQVGEAARVGPVERRPVDVKGDWE